MSPLACLIFLYVPLAPAGAPHKDQLGYGFLTGKRYLPDVRDSTHPPPVTPGSGLQRICSTISPPASTTSFDHLNTNFEFVDPYEVGSFDPVRFVPPDSGLACLRAVLGGSTLNFGSSDSPTSGTYFASGQPLVTSFRPPEPSLSEYDFRGFTTPTSLLDEIKAFDSKLLLPYGKPRRRLRRRSPRRRKGHISSPFPRLRGRINAHRPRRERFDPPRSPVRLIFSVHCLT